MIFANPWFLLGLFTVSIPVLLHLFGKHTKKVIPFSTLRFLRELSRKTSRKINLLQLLLLILRILILTFLILAVSKPVIKTSKFLFKSGGGTTSVVLILDNSFSMQYEVEKGRTAFGIAKEIAQNVILNLKSGDSASLILTNDTNSVNSGSPSYDLSAITENIKQANASNLVADMQKSVADALTSLEKSTEYNQEIYIVADTQKISFKNLLVDKLKLSKKRKITFFIVNVQPENAVNTAVLQVRPQNYACIAPGNISITVQVRNFSSIPQVKSISLFLDGEKKTSKFLNLGPMGTANEVINEKIIKSGVHSGYVELESDNLSVDDKRYFSFTAYSKIPVLIVKASGNSDYFYISSAIAPQKSESIFDVNTRDSSSVGLINNQDYKVVVLTDVTEGLNINNYVENGGGVLLIGEGVKNLAELNFTTRQVPSLNKYLIIDWVDYLSPIFEPFKLQGSGNLSYAKFYKIISSESTKLPSDIKILAKFNDDTPALCEKDMGKGKLIFFASRFTGEWSDFYLKPTFVPLINQIIFYLSVPSTKVENIAGSYIKKEQILVPGIHNVQGETIPVNVDAEESNLKTIEPDLLTNALPGFKVNFIADPSKLNEAVEKERIGISLEENFIYIALMLILLEIIVSNLLARKAKQNA